MPSDRRVWSQEELLVVFRLYCRVVFGRLHQRNPEIVELAKLINRTPAAVAMKACNFASLDPQQQARGIKALGNVSRADRVLWEAFRDDSQAIAVSAEVAFATLTGKEHADYPNQCAYTDAEDRDERPHTPLTEMTPATGITERSAFVKTRRVQSFFRAAVLTSYDNRCALTGLAIPELLNASHIIPWSVNEKRRADPRNGICLNALHDRAFDRGLISFDENLRVIVSTAVGECDDCEIHRSQLTEIGGCPLRLPERFQPERGGLEYHRRNIFRT